jgi:murein DD-endopeptidase MepM/ murein hydrolase activator NlpD
LDLKAAPNSNVFSMYDGKVVNLRNSFTPGTYKEDSKGNFVLIKYQYDGETIYVQYNHLNKVTVTKGQLVKTGDIIGLSGTTGNVPKDVTPHVHIEVYNSKWEMVDPMDYITTKFDANYNAITNSNCN